MLFQILNNVFLPGVGRGSQDLTSAGSDPFSDPHQSRNDGPAVFKKGKKIHVHQPSVSHSYGTHAYVLAKIHKCESTDKDAWLHKQTHTPPHSSKVHLSR